MSSFAKNLDEFFPLLDILVITGRFENGHGAWRGQGELPFLACYRFFCFFKKLDMWDSFLNNT